MEPRTSRHRHFLRSKTPYVHTHIVSGHHVAAYSFAHPEGEGDPDAVRDPCGDPDCQCDAALEWSEIAYDEGDEGPD